MRWRGAAGRLLLLAAGAVVAGLAAELALRAVGAYSPASFHLLPPRARLRDAQTGWDLTYETNGAGWRDDDPPAAPAAGMRRIAVVGDSFTFGQGCPRGAIFADLLEARLTADGPRTEVLNLSRPGLDSEGYAVLVEEALLYDPEVVVVSLSPNDASAVRQTPWPHALVRRLSHRSRLFVLLREARRRLGRPPALTEEIPWPDPAPGYVAEFERRYGRAHTNLVAACLTDPAEVARWSDVPEGGPGWIELERHVARIARACRAAGCRLVLGAIPDGAQVDPEQVEVRRLLGVPVAADATVAAGRFQSRVRDLAARHGADSVDPLGDFRRVRSGLYFPLDLHWTAAGHRLYAEALARRLPAPPRSGP